MKDKFIAKKYQNLQGNEMAVASAMVPRDDLIVLTLGDPDLNTDSTVIELAMKDAKEGHTHYTHQRGDEELRAEIIKYYKERFGMEVCDDEVMVTASANLGLYLALEASIDDGDEVLMLEPFYPPYPDQILMVGGIPVSVPTYAENGFQVKPSDIEAKITPKTKAIIVNNPTNPTGIVMTRETLEGIAEVAKKHDLLVFADDIYTAFCYNAPFIPIASIEGMRERTITINSFSKDYTMTGWRVGNIICSKKFADLCAIINENVAFTPCAVSMRAALHAMRDRERVQRETIGEYRSRCEYVAKRVASLKKMECGLPQGTFYMFVDIRPSGLTSREAAALLKEKAGVAVLPGSTFGESGEGFIRLACTVAEDKLKEAFDRIEKLPEFN